MIEAIKNSIPAFDLIVFLFVLFTMAQCFIEGFTRSLLSFSKWLLAFVITIILVPKFSPFIKDYIDSDYYTDIGLGIFIYIVSLFIIIYIGKAISSAVTYSGLGSVDKTFGLIFGIFKGYVFCVCLFSLINWFFPHKDWPIKTSGTYSYEIIYKGSKFLVNEFPSKELYEENKKKIENI